MEKISPKYQMSLVKSINDKLFDTYRGYADVEQYILKWYEDDEYGNWENFSIIKKKSKDGQDVIDALATLHQMDGELLLKMAIDLGLETPDYIPCIPTFKNELKSSYETASQTFEKAFRNVETDPSLAIGLANSALESIIKEILKDSRLHVSWNEKDTLSNLIKSICKAFKLTTDVNLPNEMKTLSSSLMNACKAIDDLRSDKTIFHGKTDSNYLVSEPFYAYFIVNSVSAVGLFLLNFYRQKYPTKTVVINTEDDLPF